MMVSTKGRYALYVLIDLAEHSSPAGRYIPLTEIADRQSFSKDYVNNILKVLVANGQLASLRGKGGGYKLNRSPEAYSVGTILRLVEGDLSPVPCVSGSNCSRAGICPTFPMWQKLDRMITDYLDSVSLKDLIDSDTDPATMRRPERTEI